MIRKMIAVAMLTSTLAAGSVVVADAAHAGKSNRESGWGCGGAC